MAERILRTDSYAVTTKLFGPYDRNLRRLEEAFSVTIANRESDSAAGDSIRLTGEEQNVNAAAEAVKTLLRMARLEDEITEQTLEYVLQMQKEGKTEELRSFDDSCICITARGKPIKPRTVGQRQYTEAIRKNTIVMGIGPAGTGKTFLAVAMAVTALRGKEVSRLILTRPAVEAGERLGYLPGDLQSKIDPYLRPLYDALFEMLGADNYARLVEKGSIEIAPLAYMRGRTLDDAFIILDEAQNTTPEQMKMFLTRLGNGSKAVVTGDITQTDLPFGQKSGLREAMKILDGIDDIAIHPFTEKDVVRHKLVQRIILAYDRYEQTRRAERAERTVAVSEKEQQRRAVQSAQSHGQAPSKYQYQMKRK